MDFQAITKNVLRITTGFLFWQHGAQKLFGMLDGNQVEAWLSWPRGFAGILEFFGGILICFGIFTRPVAFLLSGQMAVAYFMVHAPQGFWPIMNGGERAALFCFIFLFLWSAGGGDFSVDGWLKRRREHGSS